MSIIPRSFARTVALAHLSFCAIALAGCITAVGKPAASPPTPAPPALFTVRPVGGGGTVPEMPIGPVIAKSVPVAPLLRDILAGHGIAVVADRAAETAHGTVATTNTTLRSLVTDLAYSASLHAVFDGKTLRLAHVVESEAGLPPLPPRPSRKEDKDNGKVSPPPAPPAATAWTSLVAAVSKLGGDTPRIDTLPSPGANGVGAILRFACTPDACDRIGRLLAKVRTLGGTPAARVGVDVTVFNEGFARPAPRGSVQAEPLPQ